MALFGKRRPKKPSSRDGLRERLLHDEARLSPSPADEVAAGPRDPIHARDTLGEALRAIRETQKLSVQDVADQTRVRRAYIEAIEAMELTALPSRPFTIGYIRAYAGALGVDPDAAVERFKADEPALEEALQAPVGVLDERDPRVAAFMVGALIIVAAIVLWNVAQRAMIANAPPPALAAPAIVDQALNAIKPGTAQLGMPLPAPVESTTPAPYETPGLAETMGLKTEGTSQPRPQNQAPALDLAHLPPTFVALGKVYDSGNSQGSVVTVQALKPAALILRGADGSVYFARQLSKGDAFRVPQAAGLTLDVSNAADFQVFVYGQSRGVLPAAQVLASKLVTAPPAAAARTPAPKSVAPPPPTTAPAPRTPPAKAAAKTPG